MWSTRNIKYSYVDDEDERKSDVKSEDSELQYDAKPVLRSRFPEIRCNTSGSVSLILFFVLTIFSTRYLTLWFENRGNNLLKKTSAYSPVFDKVSIPLIKTKVDSTLLPDPNNPAHIYRGRPGPEVDAAWERIAHIGMHALTKKEVELIQKNATEAAKTQPSWGYGPDTYMAEIDVFHQLHCLNSLRKTNILNYDYYWGSKYGYEPPVMFESHIDHCIDILRQSLMCHSDVEVATYNWRKTQHNPFPDLGVQKVCRDFDALMKWQEEVELKNEPALWELIVKPADAVDLEMHMGLDRLKATSVNAVGRLLKKLTVFTNITRPEDCK